MRIHTSNSVPDGTYFRTSDAEPTIENDGSITIYDGEGTRRSSWGAPGVHSTVVLDDDDLCVIHVGFFHKHGGGQFWRYYTTTGNRVNRITWPQLPDELRKRVLAATANKAPRWAKAPGKLRTQYTQRGPNHRTAYKLVQKIGERMYSLFDPEVEYVVGQMLTDVAKPDHNGGYYAYPEPETVIQLWFSGDLVPDRCYKDEKTMVLLQVELTGRIINYPNGKMAASHLRSIAIVKEWEYSGDNQVAA